MVKKFIVNFRLIDSYSIDANDEDEAEQIASKNFAIDYPNQCWEMVDYEIDEED